MTRNLPDIAALGLPSVPMPLEWVGMQGIDLPVRITAGSETRELHARVDAEVDLPRADTKGIHMSRLHGLVDDMSTLAAVSPHDLTRLAEDMIESHADCGSGRVRLRLRFHLLVRRPALETPDLGGWRSYPIEIEVVGEKDSLKMTATVTITYSSTCPCSASLSRQRIEEEFSKHFANSESISPVEVAAWIRENGTLATPHGQRSEASIAIELASDAEGFGLLALIDRAEGALATPVQTAVKRRDEQVFAERNGQNLMFVEDAARRVQGALVSDYGHVEVRIVHMESLHPHDAVASAAPR